jgi:hypothetical protein
LLRELSYIEAFDRIRQTVLLCEENDYQQIVRLLPIASRPPGDIFIYSKGELRPASPKIGSKTAVTDEAALKFAADFYHALAVGKTIRDAFYQGAPLGKQNQTGQYQLLVRSGIDESKPLVPPFVGNAARFSAGSVKAPEEIEVANMWIEGTNASPPGDQSPNERNEAVFKSDSVEAKTIRIANKTALNKAHEKARALMCRRFLRRWDKSSGRFPEPTMRRLF